MGRSQDGWIEQCAAARGIRMHGIVSASTTSSERRWPLSVEKNKPVVDLNQSASELGADDLSTLWRSVLCSRSLARSQQFAPEHAIIAARSTCAPVRIGRLVQGGLDSQNLLFNKR